MLRNETLTNKVTLPEVQIQWRVVAAVMITVICWGSAFAGIRVALHDYTPWHLALLRYLVASLALVIYAGATQMPLPAWRDIPGFAVLGLVGITVYNIALNYGQVRVPAATASFLIASAPVWIALLASVILGEKLRGLEWVGIAISFTGVTIIAISRGGGLRLDPRALVVVIAALAQSFYSLGQKPLLKRYSPLQCTAYAIWAGAFFLLPFAGGLVSEIRAAKAESTLAIIYMGLFPGALGYVMWAYALSFVPAAKLGITLYMVPLTAMLIAWVWLGEVPALMSVLGGLLVLTGVILVSLRKMMGSRKA